jgi:hypothetical protein
MIKTNKELIEQSLGKIDQIVNLILSGSCGKLVLEEVDELSEILGELKKQS